MKSLVFVGTVETERMDYINRHNVMGCQESSQTSPLCQGVSGVEADYNFRQDMSRGVSLCCF